MNPDDAQQYETTARTLSLVDMGFIFVLVIVLICLGYLAWRFLSGIREIEGMEQEAELGFEVEMLTSISGTHPVHQEESFTPQPESRQQPNHSSAVMPSLAPQEGQADGVDVVRSIARKLQGLQVIESLEGRVSLPLPPDGEIYRLRAGGTCLLLPRQESEAMMHHFSRRFDLVIFPASGGDLVVLERFQNRLPSLLDKNLTR